MHTTLAIARRLAKLDRGDYDALLLAEAGLRRLGLAEQITEVLPPEVMLPAVGQGALGIESRRDDATTRAAVQSLDHAATHAAVIAERTMLAALQGGCLAPIAAWGRAVAEQLRLTGRVLSLDGTRKIEASLAGDPREAEQLGQQVADDLLAQGAGRLVRAAREKY